MDWIDDTVAVGDWFDGFFAQRRRHEGIELIIDSRVMFTKSILPSRRSPLMEEVLKARDQIIALLPLDPKVLIYCNRGMDRSVFVAIMYMMTRYGVGYREAYEMVRSKRKQAAFHRDWEQAVGLRLD